MSVSDALTKLAALFEQAETKDYIGESVSQAMHALQCGALAELAKAEDAVVAAALLHDVGHTCAPPDAPNMDGYGMVDHEGIGARWLLSLGFPQRVADLVLGHVEAKRYLVATNPSYAKRLSQASAETLRRQGGAMNKDEVRVFAANPLFKDILRLRAWDEEAKRTEWIPPGFAHYRPLLERLLR